MPLTHTVALEEPDPNNSADLVQLVTGAAGPYGANGGSGYALCAPAGDYTLQRFDDGVPAASTPVALAAPDHNGRARRPAPASAMAARGPPAWSAPIRRGRAYDAAPLAQADGFTRIRRGIECFLLDKLTFAMLHPLSILRKPACLHRLHGLSQSADRILRSRFRVKDLSPRWAALTLLTPVILILSLILLADLDRARAAKVKTAFGYGRRRFHRLRGPG